MDRVMKIDLSSFPRHYVALVYEAVGTWIEHNQHLKLSCVYAQMEDIREQAKREYDGRID